MVFKELLSALREWKQPPPKMNKEEVKKREAEYETFDREFQAWERHVPEYPTKPRFAFSANMTKKT